MPRWHKGGHFDRLSESCINYTETAISCQTQQLNVAAESLKLSRPACLSQLLLSQNASAPECLSPRMPQPRTSQDHCGIKPNLWHGTNNIVCTCPVNSRHLRRVRISGPTNNQHDDPFAGNRHIAKTTQPSPSS